VNFFEVVRTQTLSRVVAGLLALSALILTGGLVVGLTAGDLRGQLSFGLLAACAVMSVSVLTALRAPYPVFSVARFAWLVIASLVLAVTLFFGGEAGDTVMTYAMVALGFPSSLLAAPLVGTILGGATKQATGLVTFWLALAAVGYVQWFVLLARLLRQPSKL
jgi:hypothetical protein